jgi:Icc-related predicted phosphoesterase
MHAIAVADLHGNLRLYELLLRIADAWRISSIFIAGDLAPGGGVGPVGDEHHTEMVARQNAFYRRELFPLLESFFLDHRQIHLYAIQGNDDSRASEALLLEFDEQTSNFHLVNDRLVELADARQMHTFFPNEVPLLWVAGYPFVPPGAGLLTDWVKHENALELNPPGIDPCGDILRVGVRTTDKKSTATIADDLADFPSYLGVGAADYVAARTVHLFHAPPYNSALDWVPPRGRYELLSLPDHVGSIEIRRFIERTQPYLVLCGHCHESVVLGYHKEKIDATVCVNPGSQTHIDVLSLVQFDVYQLSRMRHLFVNVD